MIFNFPDAILEAMQLGSSLAVMYVSCGRGIDMSTAAESGHKRRHSLLLMYISVSRFFLMK
jgi:hypothetical protein